MEEPPDATDPPDRLTVPAPPTALRLPPQSVAAAGVADTVKPLSRLIVLPNRAIGFAALCPVDAARSVASRMPALAAVR